MRVTLECLVMAIVLGVSLVVSPVWAAPKESITIVKVDLPGLKLTITGTGFDKKKDTTVTLAGIVLDIESETATAMGLKIPPEMRYLADRVIE